MEKEQLLNQEKHLSTNSVLIRAVAICLGGFYYGYCLGVLNTAQDTMDNVLKIKPENCDKVNGLLNGILALGALLGCIITPQMVQKITPRMALIIFDFIATATCLLCFVDNLWTFVIYRFILGFGVGVNCSIVPSFNRQFTPLSLTGLVGCMYTVFLVVGIISSYFFGLGFTDVTVEPPSDVWWRVVFMVPMIPCTLRAILLIFVYTQDSPQLHVRNKNYKKAREVLGTIYKADFVEEQLQVLMSQEVKAKGSTLSITTLFSRKKFGKQILVGIILQFLQQFSGINSVTFYSTTIFAEALPGQKSLQVWLAVLTMVEELSTVLLIGYFIGKFNLGRKTLLLWGCILCTIFLGIIAICAIFQANNVTNAFLNDAIIILIFCFIPSYASSLGPVVWLYNAEILPTNGIIFSVISNWTGVLVVTLFFPIALTSVGLGPVFFFFTGCTGVGIFLVYFLCIETRGLNFEQIQQQFVGDASIANDTSGRVKDEFQVSMQEQQQHTYADH